MARKQKDGPLSPGGGGKPKGKKMPAQLVSINECRQAEHAQRLAQAMRMRADGASLQDIADQLNVSVATARQYWRDALQMVQSATVEDAEECRRVLIRQAEERISKWSKMANMPHVEGADRAAAIVIRDSEHLARLMGLEKTPPPSGVGQAGTTIDVTEALRSPATREALKRLIAEAEAEADAQSENMTQNP